MIWINGACPFPSFNQTNYSAGFEPMLQSMRIRHTGLARQLMALWLVLFFACSFSHAHAGASEAPVDTFAAAIDDSGSLHTSACHTQLDLGNASTESCNALQNSPLNQQLLMLLALAALLGLAGAFDPLSGLARRLGALAPRAATPPGLPTPLRKRLHRYNE